MTRAALAAVLCLAALAACGRRQPPPAVAVLPAPAGPGVGVPLPSGALIPSGVLTPQTIAGTYDGRQELVRSTGRCARSGNTRLVVRDTVVRWRVDRSVPEIAATVALDGTFAADNGSTIMRGQFTPGRVDFDAGTATCGYRYTLVKR